MSKGVSKQCSILNYLRRVDEDLHELLQDLCIGKMLVPRRGSPGITFLRPDKALLKEIQHMAAGDDPENAIAALQSLVLLDNLPTIKDFQDKKSDIPTYLRKKLQVGSVDGKKVVLSNGAEIVPDNDFKARNDRDNISVYIISKALIPLDGAPADFSNAKKNEKKGGASLCNNRKELFERVLQLFCGSNRDPAMELLVAMHGWAKAQPDANHNAKVLQAAIENKASYDTLATLAIILQPYNVSGSPYMPDEVYAEFKSAMYAADSSFEAYVCFSRNKSADDYYRALSTGGSEVQNSVLAAVQSASEKLAEKMGKLNAVRLLVEFYETDGASLQSQLGLPAVSKLQLYAESELRVLSATVLDNSNGRYDFDELSILYRNCKLDRPYICDDKDLVQSANLGFYYSTVYLIARSDVLFYVPSVNGTDLSRISNDNVFLGLNKSMRDNDALANKRAASQSLIVASDNLTF